MLLSFTALDKHVQFRSFSCHLSTLESAFDILSTIVQQGDIIIAAHLVDEGRYLELPPEAFDGEPFSEPIHQLEKQWQTVLSEPVHPASSGKGWLIDLTRHRVELYECKIGQHQRLIDQFEYLRRLTEETSYYEPRRTKLINRYDSILATYRRHINQAKAGKQQAIKKLRALECHQAGA